MSLVDNVDAACIVGKWGPTVIGLVRTHGEAGAWACSWAGLRPTRRREYWARSEVLAQAQESLFFFLFLVFFSIFYQISKLNLKSAFEI